MVGLSLCHFPLGYFHLTSMFGMVGKTLGCLILRNVKPGNLSVILGYDCRITFFWFLFTM